MPYIGTCFRFYTQMQVQKNNKAFAYRIYSHFTQQCSNSILFKIKTNKSFHFLDRNMYDQNIVSIELINLLSSAGKPLVFGLVATKININMEGTKIRIQSFGTQSQD